MKNINIISSVHLYEILLHSSWKSLCVILWGNHCRVIPHLCFLVNVLNLLQYMVRPHEIYYPQLQLVPSLFRKLYRQKWVVNNLRFFEEICICFKYLDNLFIVLVLEDVWVIVLINFEVCVLPGVTLFRLGHSESVYFWSFQVIHFGDVLQPEE